jgi:hypothetical protein
MDFDLMARDHRAGDRSRREDDRYLFLEALLSAREHLHVSWVGRSIHDNEERPPSVLVAQLRDHIAAGWRLADAPRPKARRPGAACWMRSPCSIGCSLSTPRTSTAKTRACSAMRRVAGQSRRPLRR